MKNTAVPLQGQERNLICQVLTTPCKNQEIYESIRFTHIYFYLEIVDGQLVRFTLESPTGILHVFDLRDGRAISYQFRDSFPGIRSCGFPSSLATLTFLDEKNAGGRLIAYGVEVGCPGELKLKPMHENIPYEFQYLSIDGAVGYEELN